jgi:xanthine phosphoribosyltransferase
MKYQHARLLIEGKTPGELLMEHMRNEAIVMPNNVLKVNSFLNHQVDCHLLSVCGHGTSCAPIPHKSPPSATGCARSSATSGRALTRSYPSVRRHRPTLPPGAELARRFRGLDVTKVLTGFGSGLMCAQSCAMHMRLPLVFATDPAPLARPGVEVYEASIGASSSTGRAVKSMFLSSEFMGPSDRVVIIDDMLSKGGTVSCLAELVAKAGAAVVACGFLIEKEYEGGRKTIGKMPLQPRRIESLVRVRSITNGIEFAED